MNLSGCEVSEASICGTHGGGEKKRLTLGEAVGRKPGAPLTSKGSVESVPGLIHQL